MDSPFRFEGRVWIRLSDLPQEIRLRAAEKVTNEEIKTNEPIKALLASRDVRLVAIDPVAASMEIPDQCSNRVFSVSAEAYEKVTRTRKRKAVA